MAIKYGFFNSVNGDRVYNAEDLGRYLHGLISSGVYADSSDSLQVLAIGGRTIAVQPGRAMLDCHYMENDAPLTMTLPSGANMGRIDVVVMRLNLTDRTCGIYIKQGSPGLTPVRPSLTRTDTVKEWMLASINVPGRSEAFTQSAVTDTRSDTTVCGWVTGVINQMDTTTLFLQMEKALQEKSATFDTWMTGLAAAVPFAESAEHPGCLCRIQDGETEWLNPPMEKGVEYRTAERAGLYPVYVKRLRFFEWEDPDLFYDTAMNIQFADIPGSLDLVDVSGFYVLGGPSGNGRVKHPINNKYTDLFYDASTPTTFTLDVDTAQTIIELDLIVKYVKITTE